MNPKFLLSGCFSVWSSFAALAQLPAIGTWQEHLPYHQAIAVDHSSDRIWCATPYSLFSVSLADNSLTRLSKVNGLHATGISAIRVDSVNNKLIIAYTNSDVDVLSGNRVFNVPALRQASIAGDKTVFQVLSYEDTAYFATGLGIVVLDEDKYEIRDSWIIGNAGDTVAVHSLATDGRILFAATDEGLKQAPLHSPALADFHNWTQTGGTAGLGAGPCRQVVVWNGQALVLQGDSVFLQQAGSWQPFYADGWPINGMSVSGGKLLLCEQLHGAGRVLSIGPSGSVDKVLSTPVSALQSPRQAIYVGNEFYVADSVTGLSGWTSNGPEAIIPNSPQSLATGEMTIGANGMLWVASGGADSNWLPLNNHDGLYRFDGTQWTNYNGTIYPTLDSLFDFVTVAIDPVDSAVWAGSFGEGLLRIRPDNSFSIFAGNGTVAPVQGQPSAYRVGGLAFDREGNEWIANYGAAGDLLLRTAAGAWIPISIPFPHTENAVSQIVVDNNERVWIVSPGGNGLFCYDHGPSLDNIADDQWKYYRTGTGAGNLPDDHVYSIVKDRGGLIWVGTVNGIGVIPCTANVFSGGGCDAVWPIVQFDNFAGYLFSGQPVQAMAVDGADRKWIGTNNGVWLISPDAQKIIYHFTSDSTPLLSNDVRHIAVDPSTGEVYFATAKGICSFRSTATSGAGTNSKVLVFPNPVPPGYTGAIAIRGLVEDAIVKITGLDGRLIYQTRALGGQAVWNGRDYAGRQVVTGIYLVLVSDDSRQEKMATKIIFIGK
ncbi:MAG: two-component regulator propeller domain-containing protein [Bacteroidota bacterium]|nr:two-component regulator propeller domain-containing protein [Bacteroidota bacterium]